MEQSDQIYNKKWYDEGYEKGCLFARHEADYDELAAVYRAREIPTNWDIYRRVSNFSKKYSFFRKIDLKRER